MIHAERVRDCNRVPIAESEPHPEQVGRDLAAIAAVLVNGVPTWRDGCHSGSRAGQVIAGPGARQDRRSSQAAAVLPPKPAAARRQPTGRVCLGHDRTVARFIVWLKVLPHSLGDRDIFMASDTPE
jgi:hypothetical protein